MNPREEFQNAFFEALFELGRWERDPQFPDRAKWAENVYLDLLKLRNDWEQVVLPEGPTDIGQLGIKLFDQPEDQKLCDRLSTMADIYNHRWRREHIARSRVPDLKRHSG